MAFIKAFILAFLDQEVIKQRSGYWQDFFGISATIRIGQEMLCLPHAGFFLGTFEKKWKSSVYLFISGSFLGAYLGAFDKYVEFLCYFWELFEPFGSIQKLYFVAEVMVHLLVKKGCTEM